MTRFRPCIDLHDGSVKQIVGGSLSDSGEGLVTNFESDQSAAEFALRYKEDGLRGGHVIKLGPGNDEAARLALGAYPGGLQLGGGVSDKNAEFWLQAGASHVIVTSWLFSAEGEFLEDRLFRLVSLVGSERLVMDLSCRRDEAGWYVAMNRWQTATDLRVEPRVLSELSSYCDEFLVHAADVEGKCGGIDEELVALLGRSCPIPATYAGGAHEFDDLRRVHELSGGQVDLTIGSALDLFGGVSVSYEACLEWNASQGGT